MRLESNNEMKLSKFSSFKKSDELSSSLLNSCPVRLKIFSNLKK